MRRTFHPRKAMHNDKGNMPPFYLIKDEMSYNAKVYMKQGGDRSRCLGNSSRWSRCDLMRTGRFRRLI